MNAGFYGKICAMPAPHSTPVPTLAEAAQWAPEQIVGLAQANVALQRDMDAMRLEFAALKHQLEWFRRQLFGQKSVSNRKRELVILMRSTVIKGEESWRTAASEAQERLQGMDPRQKRHIEWQ